MTDVELSIIIPVYNLQDYLQNCINSIINQNNLKNYEIILIDDGSKDKSGIICDEYSKRYHFIKTIHKDNEGVSSARNVGLNHSKGKYILFVDGDDTLSNNMIEKLLGILRNSNIQLIQFNYNEVVEDIGNVTPIGSNDGKILKIENTENILKEFLKKKITISLWNKIFAREIIENLIFDEKIHHYEDKLFIFESVLKCESFAQINVLGYNYLKRKNSASYDLFKYSYLEILDVDNQITKMIEESKYYKLLLDAKANNLESKLELIKMMIKSKAYNSYSSEYKNVIEEVKSFKFNIIIKLRRKKKIEFILVKYFLKLYEFLIIRK